MGDRSESTGEAAKENKRNRKRKRERTILEVVLAKEFSAFDRHPRRAKKSFREKYIRGLSKILQERGFYGATPTRINRLFISFRAVRRAAKVNARKKRKMREKPTPTTTIQNNDDTHSRSEGENRSGGIENERGDDGDDTHSRSEGENRSGGIENEGGDDGDAGCRGCEERGAGS